MTNENENEAANETSATLVTLGENVSNSFGSIIESACTELTQAKRRRASLLNSAKRIKKEEDGEANDESSSNFLSFPSTLDDNLKLFDNHCDELYEVLFNLRGKLIKKTISEPYDELLNHVDPVDTLATNLNDKKNPMEEGDYKIKTNEKYKHYIEGTWKQIEKAKTTRKHLQNFIKSDFKKATADDPFKEVG